MPNVNNRMTAIKGGIDPILTEICRGYKNGTFIGDELFPIVNVASETGKIPTFGKEGFQTFETLRALRAPSNEIPMGSMAWDPYSMEEYDAVIRLDDRELTETGNLLALEAKAAEQAQNVVALGREIKIATIMQDPTTYVSGHRLSRTAGTYFSDSSIDFLNEIQKAKELVKNDIGLYPNLLTIPQRVWAKLRFHPKLKAYIVNLPGTDAMAQIADLARLLEFDKVLIGQAVYTTDNATFSQVWGNNIMMTYTSAPTGMNASEFDPSFGYTLRQSGYPNADKWVESNGKLHYIRATEKYAQKVVGADAGLIITNPIDPTVYAA